MQELNDVQATVLTGMRILYSEQMQPMLREGLEANIPMPAKLASQIAGLMKMIDDKTPNGIPPKAVAPAAMLLLQDMVQFIAQIGGPKPDQKVIQQTMVILKKVLIEIFTKHGKGAKAQQQPAQPEAAPQPPAAPQQGGLLSQGVQ